MIKKIFCLLFFIFSLTSNGYGAGVSDQNQSTPPDQGRVVNLFSPVISGRIQFRYTYDEIQDPGSFRVQAAKITVKGHLPYPFFKYKIKIKSSSGSIILQDAYIEWGPLKEFHLRYGQFATRFNRDAINSSAKLQLVDRSLANTFFTVPSDQGVMAKGILINSLEYNLGLFNGNGPNQAKNENNGFLYVGRLVYYVSDPFDYYSNGDPQDIPSPQLGFGFGYAYNVNLPYDLLDNKQFQNVDVRAQTADLVFKFGGFSLLGDGYHKSIKPQSNLFDQVSSNGYTVQASLFIIPKEWEISGRYSAVKPNDTVSSNMIRETTGGMTYYFKGQSLKLTGDWSQTTTEQGVDMLELKDNRLRLQFQVLF